MSELPKFKIVYLLPIGSIVLLKNSKHKLMITGHHVTKDQVVKVGNLYQTVDEKKPKFYDYVGVIWPEGDILPDKKAVFDNSDIDEVIFKGFIDEEYEGIIEKVDDSINKIKNHDEQ